MPNSYVIDGYNLIHALGMIQKALAPGGLEASRTRLLAFLAKAFGLDAANVTIVFDAMHGPRDLERQQTFRGLRIQFAPSKESADDFIEALIDGATEPRNLTVVSNDMRLQKAAQRRGAHAWSHVDLLDHLDHRLPGKLPPDATNDDRSSPEDVQRWMKEFADLENDPELKPFFDMDRFE